MSDHPKPRLTHMMIESVNDKLSDTRKLMGAGIALTVAFSAATFGLTLGAAEFSKETHVAQDQAPVMQSLSGEPVQTANFRHESNVITDLCNMASSAEMNTALPHLQDFTWSDADGTTNFMKVVAYQINEDLDVTLVGATKEYTIERAECKNAGRALLYYSSYSGGWGSYGGGSGSGSGSGSGDDDKICTECDDIGDPPPPLAGDRRRNLLQDAIPLSEFLKPSLTAKTKKILSNLPDDVASLKVSVGIDEVVGGKLTIGMEFSEDINAWVMHESEVKISDSVNVANVFKYEHDKGVSGSSTACFEKAFKTEDEAFSLGVSGSAGISLEDGAVSTAISAELSAEYTWNAIDLSANLSPEFTGFTHVGGTLKASYDLTGALRASGGLQAVFQCGENVALVGGLVGGIGSTDILADTMNAAFSKHGIDMDDRAIRDTFRGSGGNAEIQGAVYVGAAIRF